MEKSFDFGALLRNNEKKHKAKPIQLISVKDGTKRRLEQSVKQRKSNRFSVFDSIRNLQSCNSPAAPIPEVQSKHELRRQQLEKWKLEKEQKKKEQAAQKKKPFLVGIAKQPLKYEPPPKPSTSGRVTRSQTRNAAKPVREKNKSFAPENAAFKPPQIKNISVMPKLAYPKKNSKKSIVTFEPVVAVTQTAKQIKSRPALVRQNATDSKVGRPQIETRSTRNKVVKKSLPPRPVFKSQSSSSTSDMDKPVKQVPKRKSKLFARNSSPSSSDRNASIKDKAKPSTSRPTRKSLPKNHSPITSSSDVTQNSNSDLDKVENKSPVVKLSRMSFPSTSRTLMSTANRKSFPKSPYCIRASSSSDVTQNSSSDVEFVENTSQIHRTPKRSIPKSESSSEEKLRSPKSPIELPLTPEQMESAKLSPCVTMSRGKNNAMKEMKWKISEGLLDDDVSDIDSIGHFRQQLKSEIKRMTELCERWDKISEQTVLPEFVQEAILTAVGQARLLMSQKLQQFASLIERAARPEPGTALVTPADLHGFWDMVFMQVENVNMRFKKLEELRAREWAEDKPVEAKKKVNKAVAKKVAKPSGGNSRLKELIAAARKAKKETASTETSDPESPITTTSNNLTVEKTFEAGFFRVVSPIRSPKVLSTPNKQTLLKAVLSSEAKKSHSKNSTPFAMLRASRLSKNVDGVSPLPQTPNNSVAVNLFATPGRSILKSTNDKSSKSTAKCNKSVLFDDCDKGPNEDFKQLSTDSDDFETPLNSSFLEKEKENSPEVKRSLRNKKVTKNEEKEESKPTPRRRSSRKSREVETSNEEVVTMVTPRRSTRKSKVVEKVETVEVPSTRKRSTRKKALQEIEVNVLEEIAHTTPKRSSRRNKAQ